MNRAPRNFSPLTYRFTEFIFILVDTNRSLSYTMNTFADMTTVAVPMITQQLLHNHVHWEKHDDPI